MLPPRGTPATDLTVLDLQTSRSPVKPGPDQQRRGAPRHRQWGAQRSGGQLQKPSPERGVLPDGRHILQEQAAAGDPMGTPQGGRPLYPTHQQFILDKHAASPAQKQCMSDLLMPIALKRKLTKQLTCNVTPRDKRTLISLSRTCMSEVQSFRILDSQRGLQTRPAVLKLCRQRWQCAARRQENLASPGMTGVPSMPWCSGT